MDRNLKYVGIDGHSTSCVFHVVSAEGKTRLRATVPTESGAVRKLMMDIGPNCEVVFEEGEMSSWLYKQIKGLANRVVVCNPRELRSGRKSNKSDRIDAEKLARWLLRGDVTKPVYKEFDGAEKLFHLVRTYNTLVTDRTRAKNRIKSLLRSQAMPARGTKVFAATPREKMLAKMTASGARERAKTLFKQTEMLTVLIKEAERSMVAELNRHRAAKILQSIPGIGNIRSAHLIAAIRRPERFRRNRQLWTYGGLAVVRRGSSETDYVDGVARKRLNATQTRGLNRNFSHPVKAALKGAAVSASTDGDLVPYYEALIARGLKPELAKVTLARKIATLVLVLWKKGETFDVKKLNSKSV
jgi:transposase